MGSRIIYLNGPSSAGKSTLARALQERLAAPYLHLSIDALIEQMPAKLNDWTGERPAPGYSFQPIVAADGSTVYRVVAGEYGRRIGPAFRAMVVALARCDQNLIIDDIAFGAEQLQAWRDCLGEFVVLWVGITASPETLAARERARGDRLAGSARDQLARVHHGVSYDLLLDTTDLSIADAVERIVARIQGEDDDRR
jgi:chloramphenicol 3-O phosphotransferase